MGTIRQKLASVRARWPRILAACLALVLAFGLGMYVQSRRAAAEAEEGERSKRDTEEMVFYFLLYIPAKGPVRCNGIFFIIFNFIINKWSNRCYNHFKVCSCTI